jgi:hypothetical protein
MASRKAAGCLSIKQGTPLQEVVSEHSVSASLFNLQATTPEGHDKRNNGVFHGIAAAARNLKQRVVSTHGK